MSIDQENDNKWKELMKRKRTLIDEWRGIVNSWLNEQDAQRRIEWKSKENEANEKIASLERELDTYVNSKGGY